MMLGTNGQGAYLEPDKKNKFGYLEVIKRISTKNEY